MPPGISTWLFLQVPDRHDGPQARASASPVPLFSESSMPSCSPMFVGNECEEARKFVSRKLYFGIIPLVC